jgi:hypothetical protein
MRTCFPAKIYLFYEIKKIERRKRKGKKYIRSLKIVLVVLEEIFYMRSVIFFPGIFFQFFNLKKSDFDIFKGLYIC